MKFGHFEEIVSKPRIRRYLHATGENTKAAMTLYRKNIHLSTEVFAVIGCFEICLRNRISQHYTDQFGQNWLRTLSDNHFATPKCSRTKQAIDSVTQELGENANQDTLVSKMDFGFWRFLFASPQYFAAGATLLEIFPEKEKSTPRIQYNHALVFNYLAQINELKNRIAHHEPICFRPRTTEIATAYVKERHEAMKRLVAWMGIDADALLFGVDHIQNLCDEVEAIGSSLAIKAKMSTNQNIY